MTSPCHRRDASSTASRRGSLAARRVDGVVGLSPLDSVDTTASSPRNVRLTHRSIRTHTGVNEAKLARGFKDLELEMGVNIDMCVYDDAEAVKMAA